jgi:putative glutamine amidotransferase
VEIAVALRAREPEAGGRAQECPQWLAGGGASPVVVVPGDPGLPPGCAGLLLTGGEDVDPRLYGEPERGAERVNRARDDFERALVEAARQRGLPILGICRGAQVLAVAFGGSLVQDLPTIPGPSGPVLHRGADRSDTQHDVTVEEGTLLARLLGTTRLRVNSHHHQAVRNVPPPAWIVARSDDGVAEALEAPGCVLGVQWHPERWAHPSSDAIRAGFLTAARQAAARSL